MTTFVILNHFIFDLPLVLVHVALVTCYSENKVTYIILLLHFIRPIIHTLKSPIISKVIAYDCGYRISVIHAHETSKAIRTTSIPNMHLYYGSIYIHFLLHIGTADSDIIIIREGIITVSLGYTWFTNTWIAEKDNFGLHNGLRLDGIFWLIVEFLRVLGLDFKSATLLLLLLLFTAAAATFFFSC